MCIMSSIFCGVRLKITQYVLFFNIKKHAESLQRAENFDLKYYSDFFTVFYIGFKSVFGVGQKLIIELYPVLFR